MKYNNFLELENKVDELYGKDKYTEALDMLDEGMKGLPKSELEKYKGVIKHKKALYYIFMEKYEESLSILEDLVNDNFLCGPWLIDRIPFKEDIRVENLIKKNNILLGKEKEKAKVRCVIHIPKDYSKDNKYPLFIALHGGGGNIEEFSYEWKPNYLLERGFIVMYVQSSQVSWQDHYNWNDTLASRDNVEISYDKVLEEYSIDEENVIISGFCGGAIPTVDIGLGEILPIKGFIGLCPYKPETFSVESVESAFEKGVKGVFIEGELRIPMEEQEEMTRVFDEVGFQYEFYINKGIGVSVPKDFDDKLELALNFILD